MPDTAAFAEFYGRYPGRLRGFVVSVYGPADADDLAQDAMVRAYRSYARLDPERDPWPWLVAIVRNVARDRYARPAPVPLADVPVICADGTADVEERVVVRAALGRLSSADRRVLLLRECDELSFGELSRLLGRSPNTLRQQVFRARRRLAAAYTALGGRALGVLGWVRWRTQAAGGLAAAVVTGAVIVTGQGPGEPGPPPRLAPAVTGPVADGGSPTGPVMRGAVPARPLLRSGTTPVRAPRATRRAAPERPPAATRPGTTGRADGVRVGADTTGYDLASESQGGAGVVCAVAAVCAPRQNGRG